LTIERGRTRAEFRAGLTISAPAEARNSRRFITTSFEIESCLRNLKKAARRCQWPAEISVIYDRIPIRFEGPALKQGSSILPETVLWADYRNRK